MPTTKRILERDYKVKVWNEDGWWIAEVFSGEDRWCTQGRTKEEIWMMIGDSVLTVEEVPISWWNRIVSKLLIYR